MLWWTKKHVAEIKVRFRSGILSSISLCFSVWIRGLTDILFFVLVVLRRSQPKVQVQKAFYIDLRASAEPAGGCQRPRYCLDEQLGVVPEPWLA